MFLVGLIPIGTPTLRRWWMASVGCWGRSRSQRRKPGISGWLPGWDRRDIWSGSGWKDVALRRRPGSLSG